MNRISVERGQSFLDSAAESMRGSTASASVPARADNESHTAGREGGVWLPSVVVPEPWGAPLPIPSALLPVMSFDVALLPSSLAPWVADIAERMQCPPDFPAVGAMVALSSIIGRKACISPKRFDDWQVTPNLWGAVVGRPGVMKSPALAEVLRPLDRLAAIAGEAHKMAMRNHEIKAKLEGMTGKAAESKAQKLVAAGKIGEAGQLLAQAADAEEIGKPALRRYKVTDSTVEALGEILIENPWGVLAYRDELNGLLRSLDKEGQEGARAFYLQGYDGNQGHTSDRIVRGKNLHIEAVCISMLGGIQPGKLQAYIHDAVSGGAGDDGLLQRFGLLVWPDVAGEWRNEPASGETSTGGRIPTPSASRSRLSSGWMRWRLALILTTAKRFRSSIASLTGRKTCSTSGANRSRLHCGLVIITRPWNRTWPSIASWCLLSRWSVRWLTARMR